MDYLKLPVIWLASHQALLIVFSIWHIIFNLSIHQEDYVLAGFVVGFMIHTMLFVSWSIVSCTTNICIWSFSFCTGCAGWAISLCLILSLHHWSMTIFLFTSLAIPLGIGYFVFQLEKSTHSEWSWVLQEQIHLTTYMWSLGKIAIQALKQVFSSTADKNMEDKKNK
jgi:hypothetical protein